MSNKVISFIYFSRSQFKWLEIFYTDFDIFLGRCQGAIPSSQFKEQPHQMFCTERRMNNIKSIHEELALQWLVTTSTVRQDAAANNSRLN